ncbi:hypothetical protein FPOAC2_11744 [Fusarium poae]|uniref:Uncharacterized protein n=1 Tax=Fusarium poae TaxID=36050 RepID=A0A1B8AEH6_FUSPO|nr:hypothetical protein FPOAC1_011438 [Fusarium poae]KAG8666628.1 hypothetical protein FPOAC1_011438 [Fusarium poae]OBS18883.1 hypothetical protein FPOA_10609 [Fusarium poae]
MKVSVIAYGVYLSLPSVSARVISDTCVVVDILPLITVNKSPDGYENEYIRYYSDFFAGGLTTKAYTITQTCPSINCQPPPLETAPPPGFTYAVIQCNACNNSHAQIATLTFPTESFGAYSTSGYLVLPTIDPLASAHTQLNHDKIDHGGHKILGSNRKCIGKCTENHLPFTKVSPGVSPEDKSGSNGGTISSNSSNLPSPAIVEAQAAISVELENQSDSETGDEGQAEVEGEGSADVKDSSDQPGTDRDGEDTDSGTGEKDEKPEKPAEVDSSDSAGNNPDVHSSSSSSLPLKGDTQSDYTSSGDSDDSSNSSDSPDNNGSDSQTVDLSLDRASATSRDTPTSSSNGSNLFANTNTPEEDEDEDKDIRGGSSEEPILVSNATFSKANVFGCTLASIAAMVLGTLL